MKVLNNKTISYLGLLFVVFIWGCAPLLTLHLYKYYSPTIRLCFSELVLFVMYALLSKKCVKRFNIDYIKVGVPTGVFLVAANICQKIGLMYTTPARYAFLENLSCITVPIIMYFLTKKKPGTTTIISCFVCLASVFALNGMSFDGNSWGVGEILCAVAGLLYGFNIAGTGVYARKLIAPMYLAVQSAIGFVVTFIFSLVLNNVTVVSDNGIIKSIEEIEFSFKPEHIALVIIITVVSSALCWIIRTNSMKHIDASIVAIIMPFSAVVTGVLSVVVGKDCLDMNLILGSVLGVLAIFLSTYDDIFKRKLKNKT